jgi:protein-S-isoprenylcysteine O-methyltransferase Ste14
MNHSTWVLIEASWIAWAVYWVAMAFATKRTVERGGFFGYRVVTLLVLVACVAVGRLLHLSTHSPLWRAPLAVGVVSDCIVLAGAVFTVWARIVLGRNWSAEVTFKQDHELIESGPYALARHPIYTGLILMGLGTAIDYGRAFGFAILIALCCGLWWKARQEERIMRRHFPRAYADYRTRVRAIVPFVL